jgi:hypothetical protein
MNVHKHFLHIHNNADFSYAVLGAVVFGVPKLRRGTYALAPHIRTG